jgi:hypothetical protein
VGSILNASAASSRPSRPSRLDARTVVDVKTGRLGSRRLELVANGATDEDE